MDPPSPLLVSMQSVESAVACCVSILVVGQSKDKQKAQESFKLQQDLRKATETVESKNQEIFELKQK